MLAAQAIASGERQVAVAGGMESMSNAPHLLPRAALNPRALGTGIDAGITLRDSLVADALWDNHLNQHMGTVAEGVGEEMGISRNEQVGMGWDGMGRDGMGWDGEVRHKFLGRWAELMGVPWKVRQMAGAH